MIKIQSLNQNQQFRSVLGKNKLNNNYFTIYFMKKVFEKKNNSLNMSFVTKKKVGTAVKRNKIRRKLCAAVQKVLTNNKTINLNYTYIIFGKFTIYKEKFSVIFNEINKAFGKIKK